MAAFPLHDDIDSLGMIEGFFVGATRAQGVVDIRQRHNARHSGVGRLQHLVIVGVHRDVGVHVAVAGVHVQGHEHAPAHDAGVDGAHGLDDRRVGLAGKQHFQVFQQLALDADPQHEILSQPSEIQTTLQAAPQAANKFPQQADVRIAESAAQPAEALGFEDLKHFMFQHLQQYCGLMAKLLIEKIKQSEQLPQLKACQMQWITQLQESRILPQNLNAALQQVNRSMRTLQGS